MKIEITSRANPRLKELLAAKEKLFFFEGEKLVRDILARELTVQQTAGGRGREKCLPEIAATVEERWQVSRQVLEKVSDLKNPPPLVAVLAMPEGKIDFLQQPLTSGLCRHPGSRPIWARYSAALRLSAYPPWPWPAAACVPTIPR